MATARNEHLRRLAQRVADALPAELIEEVVLTGSVSRGMADEVSDIEMLVVTREPVELADCFRLARAAGLAEIGTWGAQGGTSPAAHSRLSRSLVQAQFVERDQVR